MNFINTASMIATIVEAALAALLGLSVAINIVFITVIVCMKWQKHAQRQESLSIQQGIIYLILSLSKTSRLSVCVPDLDHVAVITHSCYIKFE